MTNAETPTINDYIDTGLRLDMSARRTLALYREMGGRCRNGDWFSYWKVRRALWLRRVA